VFRAIAVAALVITARAIAFADPAEPVETETAGTPLPHGIALVGPTATWRYQIISVGPHDAEPSPPAKWPTDIDGNAHAKGAMYPKPSGDKRIAALYAVTTFAVGADAANVRMLEIRLRYRDGCAIWLDGSEVGRRALAMGKVSALAEHAHGSEWETFYTPIAPGQLAVGDHVLAIEVHPAGGHHVSPELSVDVVGRSELGIVRGPVLAKLGTTTATIAVETDPGLGAQLEWGDVGDHVHRLDSPPGARHSFDLTGLPPKAQVTYRVIAGTTRTPRFTFHTAPVAGDVIRIGVYGDTRGGHEIHHKLVEQMLGEALDLVAVTGDMVVRGTDEGDWQRFFTIAGDLLAVVPFYPAIGNHDLGWTGSVFALPPGPAGRPTDANWYSLDLADIHLVFLDSNAYERTEQEQWLDADLAAARGRNVRAILAFTHAGPYARGIHRGNAVARERYVPILARYHVDLLLAGHDHLYQRGFAGGIHYIVSGGGGASLYQISCGVSGKPACTPDGMQAVKSEHHYVVLEITGDALEACPRLGDGRLLEPCTRIALWHP